MMFNDLTWRESEQKVQEYMRENGFKILETNFSCVGVELDIVAILPKKIQKKQAKNDMKQRILEDKKHSSVYKNSFKTTLNYMKTFRKGENYANSNRNFTACSSNYSKFRHFDTVSNRIGKICSEIYQRKELAKYGQYGFAFNGRG